jgi:hypothetical protein
MESGKTGHDSMEYRHRTIRESGLAGIHASIGLQVVPSKWIQEAQQA